jgi:hypothetical protein
MSYFNERFSIDDALKNSINYNWAIPSYQGNQESSCVGNSYGNNYYSSSSSSSSSSPSSPLSTSFSSGSSFSSAGAQVSGKGRFAPY